MLRLSSASAGRLPALGLLAGIICGTALGGTKVSRIEQVRGFWVVGIAARTNNAKEMTKDGVIPRQWERFSKEGILQKIAEKTDPTIFALYTDYASDRSGDYTYVLGAKVRKALPVPPGMVAKEVPEGKYAVFTSEQGAVGKVVAEAWMRIWIAETESALGGPRTYKTDFEVYDQRSRDPQHSQVDIYVGIR